MATGLITGVPGVYVNGRGQRLHTLRYRPRQGDPGALLFLHHGLAEHCGRYDKVCRRLAENGVEVFTYDAHGHGRSEPLDAASRAYVHSYTHLVDDLSGVMDSVLTDYGSPDGQEKPTAGQSQQPQPQQVPQPSRQRGAPPPVFLLGHSMGGLVACLLSLRRQGELAGLMLHSPLLDVEWTPLLRAQAMVGGLLATLVPRARLVPAVRPEDMSTDPRVVADYVTDPLNTVGNVRVRTGNELMRGVSELQRRAGELKLPLYVCHGSRDACTAAAASRRFVEAPAGGGGAGSADKVFRCVEGGFHELLHGPEWEGCTLELLAWMRGRGARVGGGTGAGAGGAEDGGVQGAGGVADQGGKVLEAGGMVSKL